MLRVIFSLAIAAVVLAAVVGFSADPQQARESLLVLAERGLDASPWWITSAAVLFGGGIICLLGRRSRQGGLT